jgi:hypothetical protein
MFIGRKKEYTKLSHAFQSTVQETILTNHRKNSPSSKQM